MKIKKSLILGGTVIIISFVLTGCNLFDNEMGELKSAFNGREAIIETYDENSNVIDRIQGKSIDVNTDDEFKQTDEKGNTIKKSSVLNITVGEKRSLCRR